METILQDPEYVPINTDPKMFLEKTVTTKIKENTMNQKLIPTETKYPKFYDLPKIHNERIPPRSIDNSIGSPLK